MDSVQDRAEQLREKIAAMAIPTSRPSVSSLVTPDCLVVCDNVWEDPYAYRAAVLALDFRSIPLGPVTFHGIAQCDDHTLADWIVAQHPEAKPGLTFFRRSPLGQEEPNYIHTDRDMGDWTAILYLNPHPPEGDGTTFWRHRHTGAMASTATNEAETYAEWMAWRDREQWEPWTTVPATFNRLLMFHAPLFHSRALHDNYGEHDDARLIQIVFGIGSLKA